jgi:hypothetical protein
MNQPGEHYAMYLRDNDGDGYWRQFGIMGHAEALAAVKRSGSVRAVDMVTNVELLP